VKEGILREMEKTMEGLPGKFFCLLLTHIHNPLCCWMTFYFSTR